MILNFKLVIMQEILNENRNIYFAKGSTPNFVIKKS